MVSERKLIFEKAGTAESELNEFLDAVEKRFPEREKKNKADTAYQRIALDILRNGKAVGDRTGTGTIKKFGYQVEFDLSKGEFPLLTTKKLHTKAVFGELVWFISGGRNVRDLQEMGIKIWDEWAGEDGDLGPIYGYQWRSWPDYEGGYIDQLGQVIEQIKNDPMSRRHIVSSWNVGQIDEMALHPCHLLYQFDVEPGEEGEPNILNCQMYQRSADLFLGVPFNIASYAALTEMVAQVTDTTPGRFIHTLGDTHIYSNHINQIMLQLTRDPYPAPQLTLNPEIRKIDEFRMEDIVVQNYQHHPFIKAPISV